jgi:hypothetical protein
MRAAFHHIATERGIELATQLCIDNPHRIAYSHPW